MKTLNRSTLIRREKKLRSYAGRGVRYAAAASAAAGTMSMSATGLAAATAGSDPMAVVNNTRDFLLNLLMGVGVCFIAFGVLSLAIAMQSHDDSQKSKAIMAIIGGAIAVSVRTVINFIIPGMA